jgi:uncharacterized membrane protein
MAPHPRRAKLLHRVFALGIWVKGIDGVLEIIGGVVLLLTSNAALNRLRLPFVEPIANETRSPSLFRAGASCAPFCRVS